MKLGEKETGDTMALRFTVHSKRALTENLTQFMMIGRTANCAEVT